MRALVAVALTLALGGCAIFTRPVDEVRIPKGKVFVSTYRLGQTYAAMREKIITACAARKMPPDFCAHAAKVDEEWTRHVERPLLTALGSNQTEVDWDRVIEALELVAGLAGKAL